MKIKKIFLFVLSVLMAVQIFVPCIYAQSVTKNIDVVLVIDDTLSMLDNDPDGIASLAIKKFVDKLATSGDQIGVVTYAIKVLEVYPFSLISNNADIEKVKDFAGTKILRNGSGTDAAIGLRKAAEMIKDGGNQDNKQAIVLVSDGKNEYAYGRTEEMSLADLDYVKNAEIPVYTIGINSPSQDQIDYLTDIAASTGGKAYFIANGNELTSIMSELQSLLIGLEGENETVNIGPSGYTLTKVIPENVFYANIQLDHAEPITVKLLDDNGNEIPFNQTDKICTTDVSYTNIKLVEPEAGNVNLHITSENEQPVIIEFVLNNEVFTELEISQNESGIKVNATLKRGGDTYTEVPLDTLTAQCFVKNSESGEEKTFDMSLSGTTFTTTSLDSLEKSGEYEIYAVIKGKILNCQSDSQKISVDKKGTIKPVDESDEPDSQNGEKESSKTSSWIFVILGVIAFLAVAGGVMFILFKGNGAMKGKISAVYHDSSYIKQWETYAVQLAGHGKSCSLGDIIKDARMGEAYPAELNSITVSSMPKKNGISVKLTNKTNYGTGKSESILTAPCAEHIELSDGGYILLTYTP